MTAALAIAATSPVGAAILLVLVRAGLNLPARAPRPGASHVAAALADYSWRHEQLHVIRVRAHFETIRQLEEHSAEFAAVYNRPPAAPTTPGIHTIATWWLHTTPVIGRPPLPARIPTGAAA